MVTQPSSTRRRWNRISLGVGLYVGIYVLLVVAPRLPEWIPPDYASEHVLWVGPAFIVFLVGYGALIQVLRHWVNFEEIPDDAPWWRHAVGGLGFALVVAPFFSMLLLGFVYCIAVPYTIVMALLGVSAVRPSLVTALVAIPLVVVFGGILLTIGILWMTSREWGYLVGQDGSRVPEDTFWDVLNICYFSCFSFLGSGYGEYRPVGSCRALMLGAAIAGRVLEVVVVGLAVNALSR
jgi:hypothetical protein